MNYCKQCAIERDLPFKDSPQDKDGFGVDTQCDICHQFKACINNTFAFEENLKNPPFLRLEQVEKILCSIERHENNVYIDGVEFTIRETADFRDILSAVLSDYDEQTFPCGNTNCICNTTEAAKQLRSPHRIKAESHCTRLTADDIKSCPKYKPSTWKGAQ